jgi:hypothetical protein
MVKGKKLSTLIGYVQDESGSMDSVRKETISAFNEWLGTVAREDPKAALTMLQFSDMYNRELAVREVCCRQPVGKVKPLTRQSYRPRGNTPLYDAVGSVLRLLEDDEPDYDRVLVIIQTDGLENASMDFSREQVVEMVEEKEGSGKYTFAFLGVGIDAWAQGAQLVGVASRGNVFSTPHTPYGMALAATATQDATSAYLRSGATHTAAFYTESGSLKQEKGEKEEEDEH